MWGIGIQARTIVYISKDNSIDRDNDSNDNNNKSINQVKNYGATESKQ